LATMQVEARLRYQAVGLRWARSPYAWHSIGSCLAVHAESYAAAHGFPKRAAGADYHLLQTVQTLAGAREGCGDPIATDRRRAHRTPFGTGPSVEALLDRPGLELDDPRCFRAVRHWLARVERFVESHREEDLRLTATRRDPVLTECEGILEEWGAFTVL